MSGYLVDTKPISEFVRPAPSGSIVDWFRAAAPNELYASVVTFGEIRLGIEAMPTSKRRTELELWLETGLPGWFASNLLPVARNIAGRWGQLTVEARRKGMTLTTSDGLIAATAIEHGLILVTRNVKGFAGLGIPIVNPWEA